MSRTISQGDAVVFHGVNETVIAGIVAAVTVEDGYTSITVVSADNDAHVIATGGHFGSDYAIEGAEYCYLQGGRR